MEEDNAIKGLLKKKKASIALPLPALSIPQYLFKDRALSVLEVIAEYMKEKLQMSYHEIASLINRDDRTIWTVYHRAKIKRKQQPLEMPKERAEVRIPFTVLQDRNVAVLEAIAEYMKEKRNLTYHEIASLLNRDDRTIWTVCYRARKKRGK